MLDYYTLQRTLEMLKESPNDEYTAQDLAILCRQGILTPVFAYNRYCMEILEYYYDSGKLEPSIGRSPEPMTTHFHDGYLTDRRLLSLLDKSVDKLELFNAMTYKSDGSGCEIALVANALNVRKYLNSEEYSVYSDNDGYTVTRESLLFPSEQVQSYIASKQTAKQNTTEQQEIAKLKKELSQQTDTPADDRELSTRSQNLAAKIILALLDIADLDKDSPPYQYDDLSSNNSLIHDQIKANGMNVGKQKIGHWLDLAINQVKDK